jgi:alkylation response protein AidB-like acyl-CoA dehydrogenase
MLDDQPDLTAFEDECAATLAEIGVRRDSGELPSSLSFGDHVAWARAFQRDLFEAGLAGITYPTDVGGRGLGAEYQRAFNRAGADYFFSHVFNVTLAIIGPTLLEFGRPEQREAYLPGMLRGDDLWVQCLSEPSGGSDLAGARTSAARDGDLYRISGSKMWTTNAEYAQYSLVLARTDWDVPKHRGLSMFVVPLDAAGVTIVPTRHVDGTQEFCQEFFDEVEVPVDALVGDENQGWPVARRVLFFERSMVAGTGQDGGTVEKMNWSPSVADLFALVRERGLEGSDHAQELLAEALVDQRAYEALQRWVPDQVASGALSEAGSAIGKLWSSVVKYRRSEIAVELSGLAGVIWEADDTAVRLARMWPGARSVTIGGGTNEVMRNQIAERVLALPRDPSDDASRPFSRVEQRGA